MHKSLKPDPDLKGTYYRRIGDIECAFKKMNADGLPTAAKFLVLYFGCEKLAQGIVGVAEGLPPEEVYGPRKTPNPNRIKAAVTTLDLSFAPGDLADLFELRNKPTIERPLQEPISARDLRDAVVHNFGPTGVGYVLRKAGVFLPMMDRFLSCRPQVLAYLRANWRGE
jgi:hypothetical protein